MFIKNKKYKSSTFPARYNCWIYIGKQSNYRGDLKHAFADGDFVILPREDLLKDFKLIDSPNHPHTTIFK